VARDHADALAVADHDISRIDRDVAAGDRQVEVDRVMADQVRRRGRMGVVGREWEVRDLRRVAKPAIGDDAGAAALPESGEQDAAGRGGRTVLAAVDDEDGARRALLDPLALRVRAVFEDAQMVEILPGRDVAQRIGRADHRRRVRVDAVNALDVGVAEPALEQRRGEGGGRDGAQALAGLVG
jgi:hypothetical protein